MSNMKEFDNKLNKRMHFLVNKNCNIHNPNFPSKPIERNIKNFSATFVSENYDTLSGLIIGSPKRPSYRKPPGTGYSKSTLSPESRNNKRSVQTRTVSPYKHLDNDYCSDYASTSFNNSNFKVSRNTSRAF